VPGTSTADSVAAAGTTAQSDAADAATAK
jgi:hypothetical protein